jgi:hypothetical protein
MPVICFDISELEGDIGKKPSDIKAFDIDKQELKRTVRSTATH